MPEKKPSKVYQLDPTNISPQDTLFIGVVLSALPKKIAHKLFAIPALTGEQSEKLTPEQREFTHILSTHMLRSRECRSGFKDYHYDVYTEELNNSAESEAEEKEKKKEKVKKSTVMQIIGSLSGKTNSEATYKAKLYVSKLLLNPKNLKSFKTNAMMEFNLSKRLPELGMKSLTFFGTPPVGANLVMSYLTGITLSKFIKIDLEEIGKNINTTSTDTRFLLSMMAARNLQIIHLRNIIHRDLAPKNIMVDVSGPIVSLTIIDLDLSKDVNQFLDDRAVGTPIYASPEYFAEKPITFKSDIYGLGWILNFIWRGEDSPCENWIEAAAFASQCVMQGLFRGITDVSETHQAKITTLIHQTVNADPDARPRTSEVLGHLEKIHLERMLAPINEVERKNEFQIAHRAGIELRNKLDDLLRQNFNINLKAIMKFLEVLNGFSHLNISSPEAIKEFIARSDIKIWRKGFNSINELLNEAKNILNAYESAYKTLNDLLNKVVTLKLDKKLQLSKEHLKELDYIYNQMGRAIRLSVEYMMTIDEIAHVNGKMQKYINAFQYRLIELEKDINIQQQQKEEGLKASIGSGIFSSATNALPVSQNATEQKIPRLN